MRVQTFTKDSFYYKRLIINTYEDLKAFSFPNKWNSGTDIS